MRKTLNASSASVGGSSGKVEFMVAVALKLASQQSLFAGANGADAGSNTGNNTGASALGAISIFRVRGEHEVIEG